MSTNTGSLSLFLSLSLSLFVSLSSPVHQFFPLFFKNSIGLTPAETQGIYVCVPLAIAVLAKVFSKLASSLGRIQTILVARTTGE